MSRLEAVLFDMDGLLIDSEPVWFRNEEQVMAGLDGPPWRHEDQAACIGGTLPRTAAYMQALAGTTVSTAEIERRLLSGMVAGLRRGVALRDGADSLLRDLAAAGIPCGLVSSSYRVLVDAALPALGSHRFAVTVAGDEVDRPKPDPEPYRKAASGLGADPRACVVFEDAPAGVAAAEAAGCLCVAVPDLVPIRPTPTRPVIASLADVSLDWLRDLAVGRVRSAL